MRSSASRQPIIGGAIALASIGMFFWWGVHFEVFDSKIELGRRWLEQGGFFFWFFPAAFGAGFAAGGIQAGLAWVLRFAVLILLAFGIGYLRGNY